MTYFGPQPSVQKLECALFEWTNKPSQTTEQAFNISLISHNWSPAPSVSSGDSVVLPAGNYFAQAFCTISRTSGSQNIRYKFRLNGVGVGMYGQSDFYSSKDNDVADAVFELTTTTTLTLNLIGIEGSLPTVLDNSRIVIWRTQVSSAEGVL